ncbi:Glycosyltransferase [hydrothermal vent metagenome]|uniref:Glycosyltransferase n=1 Tax=hydrothermal vent metagenome TaxID=652676 RepID=A0A3B1D4P3_9ZZZZ
MKHKNIDISIVIPLLNEESNIRELFKQLRRVLEKAVEAFEIIFVDDGSTDQSFAVLKGLHQEYPDSVRVIKFSRNFGQQPAIAAGLKQAQGKAVVVMDADLQDPPEVIGQFIAKWKEGFDVVYGVRSQREGETFFKKFTAELFYKFIRKISCVEIPANVGDFYLLDRKVVDVFIELKEHHRFNRGLVAWMGFKRGVVMYTRKARHSGVTKYSLTKMIRFALDAIMSFSFAPLRMISCFGIFLILFSIIILLIILCLKTFASTMIAGWVFIADSILFTGGLQLLAMGLIGEYLARIGEDTKARPLFVVEEVL